MKLLVKEVEQLECKQVHLNNSRFFNKIQFFCRVQTLKSSEASSVRTSWSELTRRRLTPSDSSDRHIKQSRSGAANVPWQRTTRPTFNFLSIGTNFICKKGTKSKTPQQRSTNVKLMRRDARIHAGWADSCCSALTSDEAKWLCVISSHLISSGMLIHSYFKR